MKRELIYRLTKKDFRVQHIKGSGSGGQHRNKVATGVRITHPESGAVGVATDSKSQAINKKEAFRRMFDSQKFQTWHKMKVGQAAVDEAEIERAVDRMMRPKNLLVEGRKDGEWVAETGAADRAGG